MIEDFPQASQATNAGEDEPRPPGDPELEALREILFSRYRRQIGDLEADLDDLERRIHDRDAFVAMITPILGDAIRRKIRDARNEMIEALYPIIGEIVMRAVAEAIRDLARTLDAQVRTSFNPQVLWRRARARFGGASEAEIILRESLPFQVVEIFLIHRETGLLLRHLSHDPEASPDSDLISGMLTAIRDFVHDSFGRGEQRQLDEIQYGDRSILIETAQHAYLAVLVDGIEPAGFRAEMRERIIELNHANEKTLSHYDGDPSVLTAVDEPLGSLLVTAQSNGLSAGQKRILLAGVILLLICVGGMCLGGGWVWQSLRGPV